MEWTLEAILSLIGSVGFPIVIAWYLLTTLNKTIKENTESNQAMRNTLTKICAKLDIDDITDKP